jgi:hypothetical protein
VLTPEFVEQRLRASGDSRVNAGPHIDPGALRAARDAAYAGAGVDVNGKRLAAAPRPKETPAQVKAHLEKIKAQQDARVAALTATDKKSRPSRLRRMFGAT